MEASPVMLSGAFPPFLAIFAGILVFFFWISIFLLIPLLTVLASRANWRQEKKPVQIRGYCGFWKRVAIMMIDMFLSFLIVPIFFNLYLYFRDGQTLGDKIFGAKLVNKENQTVTASVGRLFLRPVAKIFSKLALGIGYWPAGWREEKNAWHDSLSDTRYVSTRRILGIWVVLAVALPMLFPILWTIVLGAISGYQEAAMQAQMGGL